MAARNELPVPSFKRLLMTMKNNYSSMYHLNWVLVGLRIVLLILLVHGVSIIATAFPQISTDSNEKWRLAEGCIFSICSGGLLFGWRWGYYGLIAAHVAMVVHAMNPYDGVQAGFFVVSLLFLVFFVKFAKLWSSTRNNNQIKSTVT
jgi:hypothetical protein